MSAGWLVRPLAPEDGDAAAALLAAEWPHRADEADALRRGEHPADTWRWAAADPSADCLVAYAALWRVHGDRFRVDLVVAPAWRRRGIGGEMLQTVFAAAEREGAATLQARAYASAPDALRFLERRGFRETMRMVGLAIHPATADPERLASYEQAAAAQGFELAALADEERRDPECWRKLWRLYVATLEGWADPDPRPGPREEPGYDDFLRRVAVIPPEPAAFFIAMHGGRYAGFTGSFGTAVHPDFRGRGLANALKARAVLQARASGRETLETSTGHPAMLRANENAGFRRTYTEVRLVRGVGVER